MKKALLGLTVMIISLVMAVTVFSEEVLTNEAIVTLVKASDSVITEFLASPSS